MYYDDSVIEQSTVMKLLRHLLPLLCLLSVANMLDRLNLGYAAPVMDPALRMTEAQLRLADDLFRAGFIAASLPAAWLLLRYGARRWIAGIVVAWGIIAIAHALVWNAGSLYAVRLLLGAAEANLMPAMVFYLTEFVPERHRAKAIAALIAAAALVPVLGDQVSNLLLLLGTWFGITDWRWLFVVEGVPALWLGLHVPSELPQSPATATWLTVSERHWLLGQLRRDADPPAARFADGLRSLRLWKLVVTRGVIGVVAGSLGLFVPLAMQRTGYVPPGIAGMLMGAASVMGAAGAGAAGLRWHDRSQWQRALAGCLALAGICLGAAAALPDGMVAVGLLAIVASLLPAMLALAWVLAPCVLAGAAAAAGFAVLGMAGMLGDVAASAMVRQAADARCAILAVGCLVAAWLARGLAGAAPPEAAAPATSAGE